MSKDRDPLPADGASSALTSTKSIHPRVVTESATTPSTDNRDGEIPEEIADVRSVRGAWASTNLDGCNDDAQGGPTPARDADTPMEDEFVEKNIL